MPISVQIVKFYDKYKDVEMSVQFSSDSCRQKREGGFYYPVYTLVSASNPDEILYQKKGLSIYTKCSQNSFSEIQMVRVPKNILFGEADDCILKVTLSNHDKEEWNIQSKPFSTREVKHEIDPDTGVPFLKLSNHKYNAGNDYLSVSFNLMHNIPDAKIYGEIYSKGKKVATTKKREAKTGNHFMSLDFVYTDIYLPPGNHSITYKIFLEGKAKEELIANTINFTQPQLYWLSFESSGADIDVSNLDRKANLTPIPKDMITKTGNGDAYFEILNDYRVVFTSDEAKHSGKIANQKGKVQIFMDKPLKIAFYDKDPIGFQRLGSFDIPLKKGETQSIKLKDNERVKNFDFTYRLTLVNGENYNQ